MNEWLSRVDSHTVLWGQTIVYTAYCLAIISVVAWFARKVTQKKSHVTITNKIFYVWVGFLTVLGVSLHLVTYNTIPWVKDDLHGNPDVTATYSMVIGHHQWKTADGKPIARQSIQVPCGKLVRFSVTSEDLTYGFGLFRSDNSMVTQMQVVPGHSNNLLWTFTANGVLSIRSTEYSGPIGAELIVPDAIVVSGCGGA